MGLKGIGLLAVFCWQMGSGSSDALSELKEINKVYAQRKDLHMKVQYQMYADKKATVPTETVIMESYRMGQDKCLYKNKDWEYIQNGELVLRVDHEAKVIHLLGTKVIQKPAQDPMSAFQQFAERCPDTKTLPEEKGTKGILFQCPITGYQEAEVRYTPKEHRIKEVHLEALPGKALGEAGGYLKLEVLEESIWKDASLFTFQKFVKKTSKGYVAQPAYAQYRFIDQSTLYKK